MCKLQHFKTKTVILYYKYIHSYMCTLTCVHTYTQMCVLGEFSQRDTIPLQTTLVIFVCVTTTNAIIIIIYQMLVYTAEIMYLKCIYLHADGR